MKKSFPLLFIALILSINCFAQLGATIKSQMVKDWERSKAYTNDYLDAMPADKYGYKANDSVRTFAQQMLHLAEGNAWLVSNGTGKPMIFAGFTLEKTASAQTKDSVKYYVNASYDFAINSIKALDPAKLEEKVKVSSFEESRLSWIMKGIEHQAHHRGQTTIYLRLSGIRPPDEKLL